MRPFLFIILLMIMPIPISYGESIKENLMIKVSEDGTTTITENLKPRTTLSSIDIKLISNKTHNLLAVDEKNLVLSTSQSGELIKINTLGASHVTLTYDADLTYKQSQIWHLNYNSDVQSKIVLPPLSNIISVNNIPIDINEDLITMPPGQISISYATSIMTANNFEITKDNSNYSLLIMTASKVTNFEQGQKNIKFNVGHKAPLLVILPKAFLSSPYDVFLDEKPLLFKQYYQNVTHSWLRIEPKEIGTIKIVERAEVPVSTPIQTQTPEQKGGGCLIATAAFDSEITSQVQLLREVRDNVVFSTNIGKTFLAGFNEFYYSFSPTVADWERQSPLFKEVVKTTITPMLSTLSILNYVDIHSEQQMLGYGIGVILLNVGMYFVAPAIIVVKLRQKFRKI